MAKQVDWEKVFEALDDWSEALDYKVDTHLQYLGTKDPVKRARSKRLYKVADEICDRLAKKLCAKVLK